MQHPIAAQIFTLDIAGPLVLLIEIHRSFEIAADDCAGGPRF